MWLHDGLDEPLTEAVSQLDHLLHRVVARIDQIQATVKAVDNEIVEQSLDVPAAIRSR